MLTMNFSHQKGLSLVELMVALVVGLVVTLAALSAYLTTTRGSITALNSSRLNIETRALMDLITSEIRRTGYTGTVANVSNNPFNTGTAEVKSPSLECILFAYDRDNNGALSGTDFVGIRRNAGNNSISIRTSGTDNTAGDACTTQGTWEEVSDPSNIRVTNLSFSISYQCSNTALSATASTTNNCDATGGLFSTAASGNTLIETRNINITLTTQSARDTLITSSINQNVRIRNDRVLLKP